MLCSFGVVRSSISAFRAEDPGSNPGGSINLINRSIRRFTQWNEVREDGRRKVRCAGSGNVKGCEKKSEEDEWRSNNQKLYKSSNSDSLTEESCLLIYISYKFVWNVLWVLNIVIEYDVRIRTKIVILCQFIIKFWMRQF